MLTAGTVLVGSAAQQQRHAASAFETNIAPGLPDVVPGAIPQTALADDLHVSQVMKHCAVVISVGNSEKPSTSVNAIHVAGHRGDASSDRTSGSEAEQDFAAFAAAGVTIFDTADHYGPSEQLIGDTNSGSLSDRHHEISTVDGSQQRVRDACLSIFGWNSGLQSTTRFIARHLSVPICSCRPLSSGRWRRGPGRDCADEGLHLGPEPREGWPQRCAREGEPPPVMVACASAGATSQPTWYADGMQMQVLESIEADKQERLCRSVVSGGSRMSGMCRNMLTSHGSGWGAQS